MEDRFNEMSKYSTVTQDEKEGGNMNQIVDNVNSENSDVKDVEKLELESIVKSSTPNAYENTP
jgi:hypothetical protein